MKYVSLDIETTGLSRQDCQIIEFGAIIENTNNILDYEDMPKFHCYFKHDRYNFEPNALKMNAEKIHIIQTIEEFDINTSNESGMNDSKITNLCFSAKKLYDKNYFENMFVSWLKKFYGDKKNINLAGKNVATFDLDFLVQKNLLSKKIFKSRVIDPAILFIDWKNDKALPSLDECLERSGLNKSVSHNALEDAFDVIKILRTKYE
jgi:DNA polymerase III epsilon subunit-like protein